VAQLPSDSAGGPVLASNNALVTAKFVTISG
jgi:hypothetical protein